MYIHKLYTVMSYHQTHSLQVPTQLSIYVIIDGTAVVDLTIFKRLKKLLKNHIMVINGLICYFVAKQGGTHYH